MNKGDKITFGQYPQGENGEVLPLRWRVLDVQGDKALLLTDKLIDGRRYHGKFVDVTWETCALRKWLNGSFFKKAFSREEQSKIAPVTHSTPDNPSYGTTGGNPTQDNIFLLSIDEVEGYFSSGSERKAYATPYAETQGCYVDKADGGSWWWLRSSGDYHYYAALVFSNGDVSYSGTNVRLNRGTVRPALWLNL